MEKRPALALFLVRPLRNGRIAVESLRRLFVPAEDHPSAQGPTLVDFLSGHIGTVSGSSEAFSEDSGRRFAEGLMEEDR
jgi:hypothetical protein